MSGGSFDLYKVVSFFSNQRQQAFICDCFFEICYEISHFRKLYKDGKTFRKNLVKQKNVIVLPQRSVSWFHPVLS